MKRYEILEERLELKRANEGIELLEDRMETIDQEKRRNNILLMNVPTMQKEEDTKISSLDLHNANKNNLETEIIVEDINIDIKDTANRLTQNYLNLIYASGYESLVNSTTRIGDHKNSCLDHLLIKSRLNPQNILPIVSHGQISDQD
ncbi:hypothetical protein HHI36_018087 [Cryptolaemus montrouzieri]|uniref:Uncharacterized protein n=1 Tax=Cryptolaemus montrouzieri TaxID=559131 RepID=A0ABD2NYW4_9CUCU